MKPPTRETLIEFTKEHPVECFGKTEQEVNTLYTDSLFEYDPILINQLIDLRLTIENFIIVGSTALYLQGLLDRPVGDIDIFAEVADMNNNYHHVPSSSGRFQMFDHEITVHGFHSEEFIRKVDVFTTEGDYVPDYYLMKIKETTFKVEKVASAINAKLEYLRSGNLEESQKEKISNDFDYIYGIFASYPNYIEDDLPF